MDENKKRRQQLVIIAITVVVAIFILAYQFGKNSIDVNKIAEKSSTDQVNFSSNKTASQVSSLGPNNNDYIIPTGFDKSEQGAIKAAATYIQSWPELLEASDDDVIAALDFVTTANAEVLRKSLADTLISARANLSGSIANQYYHQSVPLKIHIISSDKSNVTISIWSCEFWAAAGSLEPQATFDLHELKLIYVENDWKIDSWDTKPGPTPQWAYRDEPLDSLEFISQLSIYEEFKR